MRLFLFLITICSVRLSQSRCRWHSPETMFPKRLVHLELDRSVFLPRGRRLKNVIYRMTDKNVTIPNVITGVEEERMAHMARHKNAVAGSPVYTYRNYSGGLDDHGIAHYNLVFDRTYAIPDVIYKYVDAEPSNLFKQVDLTGNEDKVILAKFNHELAEALQYADHIRAWITVQPKCLPELEIGRTPYDFNVTATYELYHSYKNKLENNTIIEYTSQGWISEASIIMQPTIHMNKPIDFKKQYVQSPCGQAWIDSSIEVFNTSQFTYWDNNTRQYFVSNKWIGNETTSIPRCHRRTQGNVCSVLAKLNLTYIDCDVPVAFSIIQAVSQISRHTRRIIRTDRPDNFNASRRLPVPDHGDYRYDMCEARVCEDDSVCTPFQIENKKLMQDGQIDIQQIETLKSGSIQIICRFEVIGFLDDLWSPHIYFRQWVGYNYTLL